MNISLRRGEKIYINGAVVRPDRKVCIELLNDVTFLLENHVMQASDASTPLKQLYFVVQLMLISPNDTTEAMALFEQMSAALNTSFQDSRILEGLTVVARSVAEKRMFDAIKAIRILIPIEEEILKSSQPLEHTKVA